MKKIILISANKIFLSPKDSFGLEFTTFPQGSLVFSSNIQKYLEVDGKNADGHLILRVTNYYPENTSSFANQGAKSEIKSIAFENLDWKEFQKFLSSYKPKALRSFIDPNTVDLKHTSPVPDPKPERYAPNFILTTERYNIIQERVETYEEEFDVSYNDAKFCNGYVEFYRSFKWYRYPICVKIDNQFVREEFNLIKEYFAKVINKRKRFTVSIKAKKTGFDHVEHTATSEDIQKIDTTLIDSVKVDRTKRLFSANRAQSTTKNVFTADEIFDNLDDYPNLFKQSEIDILQILADTYGLRNKRQLEFLSGKKHSAKQKIRFTLKPMFGFLFFIEGHSKDYFCWELLNSNATYLWAIEKRQGGAIINLIEEQIGVIHEIGRDQYRKEMKENDIPGFTFLFIDHKGIKKEEEGFADWKQRLAEAIK